MPDSTDRTKFILDEHTERLERIEYKLDKLCDFVDAMASAMEQARNAPGMGMLMRQFLPQPDGK